MKDAAALVGLGLGSGADRDHAAAFAANSIGIGHHELCFVCRVRFEIQDAAGKHVGSNDIDLRRLIDAFALQPQHRQSRLPGGLALLPVRHGYCRIAIFVALNEPLETEIDEGRRIDQEFCRRNAVRVLCGWPATTGAGSRRNSSLRSPCAATTCAGSLLRIRARNSIATQKWLMSPILQAASTFLIAA